MQVRFLSQEDPLKKGMATRSSANAWRIPGTEEPGRLQTTGSQRSWDPKELDTMEQLTLYTLDDLLLPLPQGSCKIPAF